MKENLGDKARISHIRDAIDEINKYTFSKSFKSFEENSMMRFASIKQLEIIGEAANHLSEKLKSNYPDVPWRKIVSFRNLSVHEYFGIDNKIIWNVINNNLPDFYSQIKEILKKI